MSVTLSVPYFTSEPLVIELELGSTIFFVGANGSGKTRLAAFAEDYWGEKAHRISAHRSLSLNPSVAKISEKKAISGLRYGYTDAPEGQGTSWRTNSRWSQKAATFLLNDFDFLVQALFANQANVALQTHHAVHADITQKPEFTQLQKLESIWSRLMPHCNLKITGDDIKVTADGEAFYEASDLSDGERAAFYLLGQVLVAEVGQVLIFDEPELHMHRAILGRLWDEVEAARPDCSFLVITHDLEFASARPGKKYVIQKFLQPGNWKIEPVPQATGFGEDITTLILGSRKPILFVEGTGTSLDLAIYRACYPEWTVIPRGASEDVIHSVVTMRTNPSLTRITCSGIVDADDYSDEEKDLLITLGVAVLPVSEIENLFLLPEVATAILEESSFLGKELQSKLDSLKEEVLTEVSRPASIDKVVLQYCRRRIDRALKKIDLKDAETSSALIAEYAKKTSELDIKSIEKAVLERINDAIRHSNLPKLLANVDNKNLLALAAKHLRDGAKRSAFERWLVRAVRDPNLTKLKAAISKVLPTITAI